MKLTNIDWDELQKEYDSGLTWKELREKFNITSYIIDLGRKKGLIKFRSKSEALSLFWKNGKQDPAIYQTKEHRKKMSKFGGLKENSGRCKHIKYTKKDGMVIDLQGTWELKLAEFLDFKSISWERNRIGFKYFFDNKFRNYFPDFYLKDFNLFLEVKGYETDKDKAKWNQFPFKLSVIKKKEIQNLQDWWNFTFHV